MAVKQENPLTPFQLRPLRAAKVSEISETTAASPLSPEAKVNFHIGNPVQDARLVAFYQNLVLRSNNPVSRLTDFDLEGLILDGHWDKTQIDKIQLICRSVEKSVPYMPRGGFNPKAPGRPEKLILEWLTQRQPEPLEYDLGIKSGRKEIIFAAGGITEALRVVLHTLSHYLVHLPARIFQWRSELPENLTHFQGLSLVSLPWEENEILPALEYEMDRYPSFPCFIILGQITTENTRRHLRQFSLKNSLFFIEVNNSPNHLSLAREAGLSDSVLRVLTPEIIDRELCCIPITLIAGNAEFITTIETVHFELKGTPPAADIELLAFLLENKFKEPDQEPKECLFIPADSQSSDTTQIRFPSFSQEDKIFGRIESIVMSGAETVTNLVSTYVRQMEKIERISQKIPGFPSAPADPLSGMAADEVISEFFHNLANPAWMEKLEQAFLSVFLSHHPEYSPVNTLVVSGSARTALSLLGFHCNFQEVIALDLSWTYEHCFPKVTAVPLTETLSLEDKAIISIVEQKLKFNPNWKKTGAVILNNPHNASGQVFDEKVITELLVWLLERDVFVIDDLSYENVMPSQIFPKLKTLRMIVEELVRQGRLREAQARNLITVHSLSKTDCFAGARLAVMEIRDPYIFKKFQALNSDIASNIMAFLLAYLFYRNSPDTIQAFRILRNQVLEERMLALEAALASLPPERNPFHLEIYRPQGSMYPHLVVQELPPGISLDWLASGLAKRGIGLIPLSTFARLEQGFDLARKTFRLTLGGTDNAETLSRKMRRTLIDLNRIIAEEAANYTRKTLVVKSQRRSSSGYFAGTKEHWQTLLQQTTIAISKKRFEMQIKERGFGQNSSQLVNQFFNRYLPERKHLFDQRFNEQLNLSEDIVSGAQGSMKNSLIDMLERELYKESLEGRTENFRYRLFDRTVHPTQMYALKVDSLVDSLIDDVLRKQDIHPERLRKLSHELCAEFLGINVPIRSHEEGEEIVTDLHSMLSAEKWALWNSHEHLPVLLSFWGDWDGSTRPSGQGHRLVAAALLENVRQLSKFLQILHSVAGPVKTDSGIFKEIYRLEKNTRVFWAVLNKITVLTNQLEKRYQHVLPLDKYPGKLRKLAMHLHLARDPITVLWQHNDRLEKRMLKLRNMRYQGLEYFFSLNKRLRKTLNSQLKLIRDNLHQPDLAYCAGHFRSILKRFALTPRIHQKMILASDQFAIDTTVHNMTEINALSGKYGNPGMVMALQVSFSTDPEAFIALDRKLRSKREEMLRNNPGAVLPSIWVVPLFEDIKTIENLEVYLDRLWEYAVQSRHLDQQPAERFSEMVCELFVAGSDLSQQVSQPAGSALYREVRHRSVRWLAGRSLAGKVRIKLGSGEPMQRQGGYYDPFSGLPAIIRSKKAEERLTKNLKASTKRSANFARSPLRGILTGGDFRTFQSNVAERLRQLPVNERAQIFFHVRESQKYYEKELVRAAEPLENTRLSFQERGLQELEMLTRGVHDEIFEEFIKLNTHYFKQILYGREEDVVGIHVISYFISRSIPPLRDRPVVRPSRAAGDKSGQEIVERLTQILPLSRYGSLLRAIGHNRAQSMILGINQLSTGLFRALSEFSGEQNAHRGRTLEVSDRILPHLPVQDILHTLRIYHDPSLPYLKRMETAFPAGNSAFLALREDNDSIDNYIGILQKELVRRQGLNASEFFYGDKIIGKLLPTFRPDLAVLLQPDLFNTDLEKILSEAGGEKDESWLKPIGELLNLPVKIRKLRDKIWQMIQEPIHQQVASFVELALAIDKLSTGRKRKDSPFIREPVRIEKLGAKIADLLRGNVDDSMRQFLTAAVQYLTQAPQQMENVPIEVLRALRDVERIVRIEKQALSHKEQDLLRFYVLQMARLCGENG